MSGSRRAAVLLVLVGAGLALVAQGRPWATGTLSGGIQQSAGLSVDGGSAAPAVSALALVAAAGAIVLATAGRAVRGVAAVLIACAGLGIVAVGLPVALSPRDDLVPTASTATGTTATVAQIDAARSTPWPAAAGLGGLAVLAGGGLAAVRGRRWAGPSRRYERPTGPVGAAPERVSEPEPTDALDPTVDESLAWDTLTRGDDPTA